jgi:hypothetical protein
VPSSARSSEGPDASIRGGTLWRSADGVFGAESDGAAGTQGAQLARMARLIALSVDLVVLLAASAGCGSSSAGDGDGLVEAATGDANPQIVQASAYDQSCAMDTDCVSVTVGNICHPSASQCPNAAISKSAYPQYQADADKALTYCDDPFDCGFVAPACCVGGKCQVGSQCADPVPADAAADTGADGPAACVAAGGQCLVGGSTCAVVGPQDCNPDRGPSGSYCCLDRDGGPDGGPADAHAD